MAVYTLAFFAHIAEWVFGSRSKVGRTAAALTAAGAGGAAPAKVRVQVAQQGGGTAVLERPKVVTRSAAGTRDVPDGPGAAGGDEQGDLYGRIAVSLTVLAFLVAARAASSPARCPCSGPRGATCTSSRPPSPRSPSPRTWSCSR